MASLEEYAKRLDIRGLMIASIISALSFVVGLFWRDAERKTIDEIVPKGSGLFWSYVTAITVTVIVVVISFILVRLQELEFKKLFALQKSKKKVKRS